MSYPATQKYKSLSQKQINELTAIYDDLLFITRQHEYLLRSTYVENLAVEHAQETHPDMLGGPWMSELTTRKEKQDFHDVVNNDARGDGTKTYVILKHIKSQDDRETAKTYAIPPYNLITINMQLPSLIERFRVLFPENATFGNTEFIIDGLFKATYIDKKNKDKSLSHLIGDNGMVNDLGLLLDLLDGIRITGYDEDKFQRTVLNTYATERVCANENIILECLGLFADKVQDFARQLYGDPNQKQTYEYNVNVLKQAEQDKFILSADFLIDVMNIRHLLRHQWDTLDELGWFDEKQAQENKKTRDSYVASYLKYCDTTLVQRMKFYVKALEHVQYIIQAVNQNWIIRNPQESNNKFTARLKDLYKQNPNITVELNHHLYDKKYFSLNSILHKLFPNIKIADNYPDFDTRKKKIDEWYARSCFLQDFAAIECVVMRHCQNRGKNLKSNDAWADLKNTGVLTSEQSDIWREYSLLRNDLSHNNFDEKLRKKLFATRDKFKQDAHALAQKLFEISPNVSKRQTDVYEYIHPDNLSVVLDYNKHKVLPDDYMDEQLLKQIRHEITPTGIEFDVTDKEIIKIKLPNGVTVNLDAQSINWDVKTHWVTNNDQIHILQTDNSKIIVDKYFRVMEYTERNRAKKFRAGDGWMLDGRHPIVLDSGNRIKEFKFKTFLNNIIKTAFLYKKDGQCLIMFSDGTTVSQSNKDMTVMHNGKTLTFNNRQEFAATYIAPQNIVQQSVTRQK